MIHLVTDGGFPDPPQEVLDVLAILNGARDVRVHVVESRLGGPPDRLLGKIAAEHGGVLKPLPVDGGN